MMVDAGEYPFGSTSPAPPPAPAPAFPPGPHSYATLTPLQPLPPLNAIPEEFGFVSSDGYNGNVSGSFTVMQANGAAGVPPPHAPPPLHAAYSYRGPHAPHAPHAGGYYDMPCEQQPQQCWDAYCQPQDYYQVTVKTEAHPHHYPTTTTPPSPGMHQPQLTPPAAPQPQPQSPPLAVKAEQGCHQVAVSAVSAQQEAEEINTKELAQRISAELKRYSIPQAIFAQRILCRSQGTLSDLLRNPKPWSKLKSGRETFRRMWKWLQEPEYQRMSSLRHAAAQIPQRAACKRKLDLHHHALRDPLREHHALPVPHHPDRMDRMDRMDRLDRLSDRKQRLLFADLQRYF